MAARTRHFQTLAAVLFFYLLLSAPQIDAARTHSQTEGLVDVDGQRLLRDGMSSCEALQEVFETRASKVVTIIDAGPNTTRTNKAAAILRTWGMTSALRRARNQECAWTEGGAVNTTAIQQAVRQGLGGSPCFPQAESMLRSGEGLPEKEQASHFFQAMSVLMSPTCNVTQDLDMDEVPEAGVGTEPVEFGAEIDGDRDLEDQADNIAEGLEAAEVDVLSDDGVLDEGDDEQQALAELSGGRASLFQGEAHEGDEFPDIWNSFARPALEFLESALPNPRWGGERVTEVVGGHRITILQEPAGGWFLHTILVALWVLAFAVSCYVITHVVAMVVKMVLCILRWLFRVIVQLGRNVWSVQRCILRTLFDAVHGNALNRPLRPVAASACLALGAGVVAVAPV